MRHAAIIKSELHKMYFLIPPCFTRDVHNGNKFTPLIDIECSPLSRTIINTLVCGNIL